MSRETDEDVLLTTQLQAWQSGVEPIPGDPADSISAAAIALEAQGWRAWLTTLGPRTFTGSFAPFHVKMWDWYWTMTGRRAAGEKLVTDTQVYPAWWSRGYGKSANIEWAAIAEGARVGKGYVLYVSGTQSLADGHVASIRERLESEEVGHYYADLGKPMIGAHGNQYGWRQDFLRTAGGWAVRPIGLDVGVRGGRLGELRPTLIIFDDVDDHKDSFAVVQKKLDTIARSILPAGTPETLILFGQNLIHRNSVANLIHTRKVGLLSRRVETPVVPAFEGLVIEKRNNLDTIVAGSPTWADMDIAACQKFLNDSGREAFLAEYQHDFAATDRARVLPEYDRDLHVITWAQFRAKFQAEHIPSHWQTDLGLDVGFTHEHLSVWTWLATAAANSPLPGKRFRFRVMAFDCVGMDEQASTVLRVMGLRREGENLRRRRMSHEALSERITLNQKYKLGFQPCKSAKTAGISEWRHDLRVDKTQPHPFHEDTQLADGTWLLGCPSWFDIEPLSTDTPEEIAGMNLAYQQAEDWRYRPTPLTDGGFGDEKPIKAFEDANDSARMLTAEFRQQATPLTPRETVIAELSSTVQQQIKNPRPLTAQEELRQQLELMRAQKKVGYNLSTGTYADTDEWAGYEYE